VAPIHARRRSAKRPRAAAPLVVLRLGMMMKTPLIHRVLIQP
jgi:hypothetical protein